MYRHRKCQSKVTPALKQEMVHVPTGQTKSQITKEKQQNEGRLRKWYMYRTQPCDASVCSDANTRFWYIFKRARMPLGGAADVLWPHPPIHSCCLNGQWWDWGVPEDPGSRITVGSFVWLHASPHWVGQLRRKRPARAITLL